MTIIEIKTLYEKHGWFYPKDEVHFLGLRHGYIDDQFNDRLFLLNGMKSRDYACTLWPGRGHLRKMLNKRGTAVIAEGQYRNLWGFGKHHGDYEALTQVAPIRVHRDNNKDDRADLSEFIDSGIFGINLHRANSKWTSKFIDLWSAGCVVVPNPDDFKIIMTLARTYPAQKYFTFTLINDF